jgi:hypothetical protein
MYIQCHPSTGEVNVDFYLCAVVTLDLPTLLMTVTADSAALLIGLL